ncbi:MAG: histone [Candidatus Korarchaeota archaeon]|nr:histone [Candidatus Korarchaeota archaeon]NIU85283.1 histone [Candidatus Thorarchaeota archaeon]NIW15381.1 histone [Candidatus Thorarchaeota archaeon]NIW53327.1 histone [Candidatus Korarchaeota archaeon]
MAELPRAGIRRLLESAGAERMSQEAVVSARDIVEQFAQKLGDVACTFCEHAGRKTLSKDDIRKAAKTLEESKGFF